MGDCFQAIVDQEATESEAPGLATMIVEWLVTAGIVSAKTPECVLGPGGGFPPGPHYDVAVIDPCEHLAQLLTNGLSVITTRSVFDSGQGGFELICSACSARLEPPGQWGDAVDEWYVGRGPGLLACPHCGDTRPVTRWTHDPPWGFGNLGFEFWNWPPFKGEFVEEVGRRLGHRVVLIRGKL